jgi:hypothetical protein
MSKKFVFLLEERSMQEFLDSFLPKVLPDDWQWQCIAHQGKSDLEKSIPRKLRGWNEPGVRFFIIRDQDSGNCKKIKEKLRTLCEEGHKTETIIRIACREMESWFLGNLQAVGKAFEIEKIAKLQGKEKYRDPDRLNNPSIELKRLIPSYQKLGGARIIGQYLNTEGNHSGSFNVFVSTIKNCIAK